MVTLLNKVGRKKTSLTYFKTKLTNPTFTGGVFIHLSPQKTMYQCFQENLLDKCNQKIISCDQRIEELSKELKAWKAKKHEALKLQKAIKEVK